MKYNIPLAGPYTSRISSVNLADSTSGYVGVGIVGLMVVGKSAQATDKDARYINCFVSTVTDSQRGRKRTYTVKRPGWGTQSTPAAGNRGYEVMVWRGGGSAIISGFGDTNSTIYSGTSSLGAITGRVTAITETVIGTTPTLTITSNDSTGWYYQAGSVTQISDGDFPGNAGFTVVGRFEHIDGFACVMTDDGKVWASDLNSITGWTANSFDTANAYPDKGIGCVRRGTYLMAFKQSSVQFYQNAGLSPFPLAKVPSKTIRVGAVAADAISRIADTIFWCGAPPEGGLSIFQFDDGLSRISTPEVEAILILAGASNITISTLRHYGRSFVLVRAGPTTLAYCVEERFWFEYNSTTPLWYKTAAVSIGGTMVNYAVSNVTTSGKVYLQNHANLTFEDDGTTYTARIQTAYDDMGTMRKKFFQYLDIEGDIESATSPLTLSYTDDDFGSYQTWGTIDLSTSNRRATRLGASSRRSWVLTHSANTPMRLAKAEGEMSVGYA